MIRTRHQMSIQEQDYFSSYQMVTTRWRSKMVPNKDGQFQLKSNIKKPDLSGFQMLTVYKTKTLFTCLDEQIICYKILIDRHEKEHKTDTRIDQNIKRLQEPNIETIRRPKV